jgi:AcrR family transcriptional regulator
MGRIRDLQRQIVLEEANKIFISNGINSTSISTLSRKIGIGEATLYRYYHKKENLVVECAILNIKKLYKEYFVPSSDLSNLNGYQKVAYFFSLYPQIFTNDKGFLSFISEFDSYVLTTSLPSDELKDYGDVYNKIKDSFDAFYHEGEKDGSIRPNLDSDLFYYTMSKGLLLLVRKLSSAPIISSDSLLSAQKQLEEYINVSLYYLKK